ncbi:MAG: hypothetical protein ALECFALPRED_007747 [Alectoria fallacina]|uniref:Uncharacterized protein n=1 Tax=Alectoria fallacina TaxID=1903189 RepID=A0A8H3J0V2_9LECA|nr:MAG: hypothetical protein ALECFALPRED_007747 [Alectoria fallacina]
MMYFFLEIIIFIAEFFPGLQLKPVGQQKGGPQKKPENTKTDCHSEEKDESKSATPKPAAGSETTRAQVLSGRRGMTQSAKVSDQNDVFIKKSITDVSRADAVTSDNATNSSVPKVNIEPAMINISFRRSEEDPTVSNGLEDIEQNESRSIDLLPGTQNSEPSATIEETANGLQDFGDNVAEEEPSSTVQDVLLKTEEAAHQRTREELTRLEYWCKRLEDENTGLQRQVEDAGRENSRIQRQLHHAENEIMGFSTELSGAEGRIHEFMNSTGMYLSMIEQLRNQAIDLNADITWYIQLGVKFYVRLQKVEKLLSPYDSVFAEYRSLMREAAQYFSNLVDARYENGDVHDDVTRFEEIDDNDHNEELEDDQENDGVHSLVTNEDIYDTKPANKVNTIQANENVTALADDNTPFPGHPKRPGTAKGVPISVLTVISGDTPQSPSTSVFEDPDQQTQQAPSPAAPAFPVDFGFSVVRVIPEEKCKTTAVQATVQNPARNTEASSISNRRAHGRGGIERGRGRPGHGRNRGKMPLRRSSGSSLGNSVESINAAIGSSPVAKASSANHILSGSSAKAEDKRDATTPHRPTVSTVSSTPVTADSKTLGTTPEVEHETESPQVAGYAPMFGSDVFAKSYTSVSNSRATFGEFNFDNVDEYQKQPNPFTPATEGNDISPGLEFDFGSLPKATPFQQNIHIFPIAMEHVEEDSSTNTYGNKSICDHRLVNSSSSKSKIRPTGMAKTPLTPAVFEISRESHREESVASCSSSVTEANSVFHIPGRYDPIAFDMDTIIAPSLAKHYTKLTQSTHTKARLREARAGKRKVTSYQPEPPKRPTWAPFSSRETLKVPPVWMPVSPTIRPSEFEHKKGESSKSQFLGVAKEEAHVAKVKDWITSVAPLDKGKGAAQKPNSQPSSGNQMRQGTEAADMKRPVTVEDIFNLTNGIAQMSIEPSMDLLCMSKKKIKVQLSGDWNVSGLCNYTPDDLEKGPIFGRFLDVDSETNGFGLTVKRQQAADADAGTANEAGFQSEIKQREVTDRQERTGSQDQRGTDSAVAGSGQEHRSHRSCGTDAAVQTNGQRGEGHESGKTNSDTESSDQDEGFYRPPKTDPAHPSDGQSSPQTEETYTSPYSLRGAFSNENATPRKKFISRWSLRYRKD